MAKNLIFSNLRKQGYTRRFLRSCWDELITQYSLNLNFSGLSLLGCFPCKNSKFYKYIISGQTYSINKKVGHRVGNLNCNSSNIIYCIKCLKCEKYYIGETKNPLKIRLGQHISHIKNPNYNVHVSSHFRKNHDLE